MTMLEIKEKRLLELAKQKGIKLNFFQRNSILNIAEVISKRPEGLTISEMQNKISFRKNSIYRIKAIAEKIGIITIERHVNIAGKRNTAQIIKPTAKIADILFEELIKEDQKYKNKNPEKIQQEKHTIKQKLPLSAKAEGENVSIPFNTIINRSQIRTVDDLLDKYSEGIPLESIFQTIKVPYSEKTIERLKVYLETNEVNAKISGNFPECTIKKC